MIKRKEQEALYAKNREELKRELITNNKYKCLFCDKQLIGWNPCHHTFGRTGNLIHIKEYLSFAHTKCHTEYHDLPIDKIKEFSFKRYITRIRKTRPSLFNKELNKLLKAGVVDIFTFNKYYIN